MRSLNMHWKRAREDIFLLYFRFLSLRLFFLPLVLPLSFNDPSFVRLIYNDIPIIIGLFLYCKMVYIYLLGTCLCMTSDGHGPGSSNINGSSGKSQWTTNHITTHPNQRKRRHEQEKRMITRMKCAKSSTSIHRTNEHDKYPSWKQFNLDRDSILISNKTRTSIRYIMPWIVFFVCVTFSIQILPMSEFLVSSGTHLYLTNVMKIGVAEEKYQQIRNDKRRNREESNHILAHHIEDAAPVTTQQHATKYHYKTTRAAIRRCLKVLINKVDDVASHEAKRKLMPAMILPQIDQSIIHIYPFTSSLQSYLGDVQVRGEIPKELEMCYEIRRFVSFCGSPCPASSIRLAQSGFYAVDGGHQTRCFSCRILYSNWRKTDTPDIVHRLISPGCSHLNGNDDRNIPIYSEPRHRHTSQMVFGLLEEYATPGGGLDGMLTSSLPQLTISGQAATATTTATATATATATNPFNLDMFQAVYPQYRDLQTRLYSYQGWGWSHVQDPKILAGAGFYYAGYRDCVRCFYCGVGLRTWEKEDDPWVEHVRWRSSCDYVRSMKGEQFVIEALAGNNSSSAAASPLSLINDNRTPSQLVVPPTDESGRDKTERNTTQESNTEPMTLISTSTMQGREFNPDTGSRQFTPHTALASSLTGISSAIEGTGTPSLQFLKVSTPESIENMSVDEKTSSNSSTNAISQNVVDPQILQRQLEEENQSLRDESTCKVCLDNPSCIVFLPCGHLVTCAECAPALRKCPVCRALIRGTVRAYSD